MPIKLLHTADWHLGQTFFGYDREEEHDQFLRWLVETLVAEQTDVLLIAGDVFDVANPPATAQRRFFRFLKEAKGRCPHLQIILIAGNHDSAARLEAPLPLLEELNVTISGIVKRTDTGEIDYDSLLCPLYDREGRTRGWCLCVPYLRQGDYPPAENEQENSFMAGVSRLYRKLTEHAEGKRNPGDALIAMGHLYAGGAELSENDRSERVVLGGLESISPDSFDPALAYTALGHIHKAQRVGGRDNVRYSGSPLPMSFSETRYPHQVVSVTIEGDKAVAISVLPIPVQVELMRVPKTPLPPAEVLAALEALPEKTDNDTGKFPFLEVRVLQTEPAPEFSHQVEELLVNKAVRLTSTVRVFREDRVEAGATAQAFADLQGVEPLALLEHAFAAKYGTTMPEKIKDLFNEVTREVSE